MWKCSFPSMRSPGRMEKVFSFEKRLENSVSNAYISRNEKAETSSFRPEASSL